MKKISRKLKKVYGKQRLEKKKKRKKNKPKKKGTKKEFIII